MIFFVVTDPDRKPIGHGTSLREAQQIVEAITPDPMEQARYQIHPIASARDAEAAKINVHWHLTLEKFEGDTLVETLEREGVN